MPSASGLDPKREARKPVDAPTVTHDAVRGYQADGIVGVSD
jgi:hypothetical protein